MNIWNNENYYKWVTSGYPKNDHIEILNCSENRLKKLIGIRNLTNLRVLNCSDNNLKNFETIQIKHKCFLFVFLLEEKCPNKALQVCSQLKICCLTSVSQ
jgi:Leucine-rich repeat (LRR) protein